MDLSCVVILFNLITCSEDRSASICVGMFNHVYVHMYVFILVDSLLSQIEGPKYFGPKSNDI